MPESALSPADFANVFPFHFVVDRERRILAVGPSLQKLLPDLRRGDALSQTFQIERPRVDLDGPELADCCGCVLILHARARPELALRGELRQTADGSLRFLGAPLITSLEQLDGLGLTLGDFPQHDVLGDLLLLLQAKDVALSDAQQLSRKLSELGERLVRSEAWFRSVLRGSSDCIAVLSPEGVVRWVNASGAALFGTTTELLTGKKFTDMVHADDRVHAQESWSLATAEGGLPQRLEFRSAHDDGSTFLDGTLSDARGDASVAGVILNARDVTRQRQLREQLLRAQKMESLGQLAGGIAHDFNNLLMVVFYGLQMIEDALPAGSPLRTHTHEIEAAAERARALTRQILAFARRSFSAPRVVDLAGITADLARFLGRIAGPQLKVTARMQSGSAETRIDVALVEQVLVGLVLNARDLMSAGGGLVVTVERREIAAPLADFGGAMLEAGAWIAIAIEHTDTRLADADLHAMLDPFSGKGNLAERRGIGLAGTYGMMRQHGGGLLVDAERTGGTLLTAMLPLAKEAPADAKPQTPPPAPARVLHVLLLEDDLAVRSMVQRMLLQIGHKVTSAADAREAVKLATGVGTKIDLLLSDIVMPGLSGPEAAALLLQQHPKMRVLFMSGYFDESIARYGADPAKLLAKPFGQEQLRKRIDELMSE